MRFAAMGLVILGCSACMLEVPKISACGDEFLDRRAGELCERGTLVDAWCPDGVTRAHCDPRTCRPSFDHCGTCLNGALDEGEECDPTAPPPMSRGSLTNPIECSSLEVTAGFTYPKLQPLVEADSIRYTAGSATHEDCSDTCRINRRLCSFCGDGELDQSYRDYDLYGQQIDIPAEQCELGVLTDHASERCKAACGLQDDERMISCDYACDLHCQEALVNTEAPACCIANGQLCDPFAGPEDLKCCSASQNTPTVDGCGAFNVDDGSLVYRCESGS